MKKASDIISDLFSKNFGKEFMEAGRSTSVLFSSWPQIVMEAWSRADIPPAAAHSRIRELQQGRLLVEADHPGWIQILKTKQAQLLEIAKHRHPELDIRGIDFRLSREPKKE